MFNCACLFGPIQYLVH